VETIDGFAYATVSPLLEKSLEAEELEEFNQAAAKLIELLGDELTADLKARLVTPNSSDKSLGNYINDIVNKIENFDSTSQATILQESDPLQKIKLLLKVLSTSIDTNSIDDNINKKIKNRIDEQQKEYYLREKLRAIKEELNDSEVNDNSIDNYRKRLNEEPFPTHVKERILSEIDKLDGIPASSTEGNIQRTYID
jgi:ATP-dependent Lon protease